MTVMMEMLRLMSHFVVTLKVCLVVPLSARCFNLYLKCQNWKYAVLDLFPQYSKDLLTTDFIFLCFSNTMTFEASDSDLYHLKFLPLRVIFTVFVFLSEANPDKFNSRFKNLVFYGKVSLDS